MLLEDRVAIVTGSSRGIGAATATLLASQGAKVVINYRRDEKAGGQVLRQIVDAGGKAILVQADVTQRDEVDAMVKRAEKELGPVDILVSNANMSFPVKPFVEYSWEDFERKLNNEMRAAFFCASAVVPGMIDRGRGAIVNISSGLSRRPGPGFVAHSSAKGALDAFSRGLAHELGRHGIRVNVVAPGLTLTDATRERVKHVQEAMIRQTPLQRLAEPEDIAGAVLFYCVDWSRFVTGSYLAVSGGTHML